MISSSDQTELLCGNDSLIVSNDRLQQLGTMIPPMLRAPPNPDFLRLCSFTLTRDAICTRRLHDGAGTGVRS